MQCFKINDTDFVQNQKNAGRVANFTIENFLYQLWMNVTLSTLFVIVFFIWRIIRKDYNTLNQKLKDKSVGLQAKFQTFKVNADSVHSNSTVQQQEDQDDEPLSYDFDDDENNSEMQRKWLGHDISKHSVLGVMGIFKEKQMIRMMGRDLTLYLKYLKYQAFMFFAIFLFSFAVLIPLYWTGSDASSFLNQNSNQTNQSNQTQSNFTKNYTINNETNNFTVIGTIKNGTNQTTQFGELTQKDTGYNLIMFTILNIKTDQTKLLVSFSFVIFVTIIVYIFTFRFWRETSIWRDQNFEKGGDRYFGELKNYVILVRGIPENIDPKIESAQIKRILKQTYSNQLIDFKIVGDFQELYQMGLQWKDLQDQRDLCNKKAKLLQFYEENYQKPLIEDRDKETKIQNKISYSNPENWIFLDLICCSSKVKKKQNFTEWEKKMKLAKQYRKKMCSCRPYTSYEARIQSRQLSMKIQKLEQEIQVAEQNRKTRNRGCAFMSLKSPDFVKRHLEKPRFWTNSNCPKPKLTLFERQKYMFENWEMCESQYNNDILWQQLNFDKARGKNINFFNYILLFVLSVLLLTPLSLYSIVVPITKKITEKGGQSIFVSFGQFLQDSASPLLIALCNVVLIPIFVDIVAKSNYNETKSEQQLKIFVMNLIFMSLNMIVLPLTGLISIQDLMCYIVNNEWRVIEDISQNIGQMAAFFIQYMMQVTFIFNCLQLLDLPHLISTLFSQKIAKLYNKPFKDQYPFELGFNFSFSCTMGLMNLIFMIPMPVMSFFGMGFFAFRYWIEKYNLIFVYFQDFESECRMLDILVFHQIFAVIIFQILNFTFIRAYEGESKMSNYGYAFVGFQILMILFFRMVNTHRPQLLKPRILKDEEEDAKRLDEFAMSLKQSLRERQEDERKLINQEYQRGSFYQPHEDRVSLSLESQFDPRGSIRVEEQFNKQIRFNNEVITINEGKKILQNRRENSLGLDIPDHHPEMIRGLSTSSKNELIYQIEKALEISYEHPWLQIQRKVHQKVNESKDVIMKNFKTQGSKRFNEKGTKIKELRQKQNYNFNRREVLFKFLKVEKEKYQSPKSEDEDFKSVDQYSSSPDFISNLPNHSSVNKNNNIILQQQKRMGSSSEYQPSKFSAKQREENDSDLQNQVRIVKDWAEQLPNNQTDVKDFNEFSKEIRLINISQIRLSDKAIETNRSSEAGIYSKPPQIMRATGGSIFKNSPLKKVEPEEVLMPEPADSKQLSLIMSGEEI